jgi:hypothetical protein
MDGSNKLSFGRTRRGDGRLYFRLVRDGPTTEHENQTGNDGAMSKKVRGMCGVNVTGKESTLLKFREGRKSGADPKRVAGNHRLGDSAGHRTANRGDPKTWLCKGNEQRDEGHHNKSSRDGRRNERVS